jgi:hypothetical protein
MKTSHVTCMRTLMEGFVVYTCLFCRKKRLPFRLLPAVAREVIGRRLQAVPDKRSRGAAREVGPSVVGPVGRRAFGDVSGTTSRMRLKPHGSLTQTLPCTQLYRV